MDIRRLTPSEIPLLTELFPYRAPGEMIAACTRDLKSGKIEIFGGPICTHSGSARRIGEKAAEERC